MSYEGYGKPDSDCSNCRENVANREIPESADGSTIVIPNLNSPNYLVLNPAPEKETESFVLPPPVNANPAHIQRYFNGSFSYKGHLYLHDCFPKITKVGERIPHPLNCKNFYFAAGRDDDSLYVNNMTCAGKSIFNDSTKACVKVDILPSDCFRKIKGCESSVQRQKIDIYLRRMIWLLPVSVENEIDRHQNGTFTFRGYSYFSKDCFPVYYLHTGNIIGQKVPAADSCRVFYKYIEKRDTRSVIVKKRCKGKRIYDAKLGRCVRVPDLPPGCLRFIKGCEKGVQRKRSLVIRPSRISYYPLMYGEKDIYEVLRNSTIYYEGYLYDEHCWPLILRVGDSAPHVTDCTLFFFTNENKEIAYSKCVGKDSYYDRHLKQCVVGNMPDNCYSGILCIPHNLY